MEEIHRNSRPLRSTETQKETGTDQQPQWIPKFILANIYAVQQDTQSVFNE